MKKALIFQNKVVDVAESEFEVHDSMSWMDCPDDCVSGHWELKAGKLQAIPKEDPPYDKSRLREYPKIADYLDGIVKDDQAQIDKYIEDCKAIKVKYPKPE
jgi:hypothetical protein